MPARAMNDSILRHQSLYENCIKIFVSSISIQLKLKEGNMIDSADDDFRDP